MGLTGYSIETENLLNYEIIETILQIYTTKQLSIELEDLSIEYYYQKCRKKFIKLRLKKTTASNEIFFSHYKRKNKISYLLRYVGYARGENLSFRVITYYRDFFRMCSS